MYYTALTVFLPLLPIHCLPTYPETPVSPTKLSTPVCPRHVCHFLNLERWQFASRLVGPWAEWQMTRQSAADCCVEVKNHTHQSVTVFLSFSYCLIPPHSQQAALQNRSSFTTPRFRPEFVTTHQSPFTSASWASGSPCLLV